MLLTPIELPPLDPNDAAAPFDDPNHPLYWAYGENAGGWRMDFGPHAGKRLTEVPYYDFLAKEYCKNEYRTRQTFRMAYNKYKLGLATELIKNCGDFIIPFRDRYTGMKLKDCHDLNWLVRQVDESDKSSKEQYDLFYAAAEKMVDEIRHPYPIPYDDGNIDPVDDPDYMAAFEKWAEENPDPDMLDDDIYPEEFYDMDDGNWDEGGNSPAEAIDSSPPVTSKAAPDEKKSDPTLKTAEPLHVEKRKADEAFDEDDEASSNKEVWTSSKCTSTKPNSPRLSLEEPHAASHVAETLPMKKQKVELN